MDRVTLVNCCVALLGLLILHGVISVEGRSMFTSGNHVFSSKEDTDPHSKILSLLLHKSSRPFENNDALGMKLANTLAELEELKELQEDLELERKISADLAEDRSMTRKRGEPCFWKYCV